jgi:purine-binding chemotaxis protein CheW
MSEIQLIVFRLGKEEYAVEIHDVSEIRTLTAITTVPHAPHFIEGIMNLRGRIVVVLNLLKRFGIKGDQGTHILISEVENNTFGVVVDSITEVLKVSEENMKAAPGIISTKVNLDYIKGVVILGERLLILLDLLKILSEKELADVAAVADQIGAGRPKEEEEGLTAGEPKEMEGAGSETPTPTHEKGMGKKESLTSDERKAADRSGRGTLMRASHSFVTKDGRHIHSLEELKEAVGTMTAEVFSHHVTEDRHLWATGHLPTK